MQATEDTTPHPLDALIADPAGKPPLCDVAAFAELLRGMVADAAPRVFAVVQEYGERVDAHIAAWGMAFDDHAFAVSTDRGLRLSLSNAEGALRAFSWGDHVHARLVWVVPDAAAQEEFAV